MTTRRRIAEKRVRARALTSRFRVLPDFVVIGAQRSGTSSLYRYLGAHPELVPSLRKETEYFTRRFGEGPDWYRAHFPLESRLKLEGIARGSRVRTFEATPDYLFHPLAADRVKHSLPDAQFIVMLRDPVARAYSHYRHMSRIGFEEHSFEEALDLEAERVGSDWERLEDDPGYACLSALRFSYASRGRYVSQLERWFASFDRDRFLIVDADEFFGDTRRVLGTVCEFLGISTWSPTELKNYSRPKGVSAAEQVLSDVARQRLEEHFEAENQGLEEMTGTSFSWR